MYKLLPDPFHWSLEEPISDKVMHLNAKANIDHDGSDSGNHRASSLPAKEYPWRWWVMMTLGNAGSISIFLRDGRCMLGDG